MTSLDDSDCHWLPRGLCTDLAEATRREWMVANGIGGYAMGTVATLPTRKYHGLLIAATKPPGERMMLLAGLEPTIRIGGASFALGAWRWRSGAVSPQGFLRLESFHLDGTRPVWRWGIGETLLERTLWMPRGRNAVCVRHTLRRGDAIELDLKALTAARSHHQVQPQGGGMTTVRVVPRGAEITTEGVASRLLIRADTGHLAGGAGAPPHLEHWNDLWYSVEAERGYDACDSVLHSATFTAALSAGQSITVVAEAIGPEESSKAHGALEPGEAQAWLDECIAHEAELLRRAGDAATPLRRRLALAADRFVVSRTPRRTSAGDSPPAAAKAGAAPAGASIIAGYPWFEDWGRDTMIALPGLCLLTGRSDVAAEILRTYAGALDEGMLPNRFPDDGGAPEYHTVDATLWFLRAVVRTFETTGDETLLRELWPALEEIRRCHVAGTRHGIRVDEDGLLRAGDVASSTQRFASHLTWMDARIGDEAITPRIGKPVEVNALWLRSMQDLATLAPRIGADPAPFANAAAAAEKSFGRFWNPATGCLFDVLDGPEGDGASASGPGTGARQGMVDDPRIRPNQIVAVALLAGGAKPVLSREQAQSILRVALATLVTSHGMRTLAPAEPGYIGRYHGDQATRDRAYHQGTVWPWLVAALVEGLIAAPGIGARGTDIAASSLSRASSSNATAIGANPAPSNDELTDLIATIVDPLINHLDDAGLDGVSEVFDGDPPHGAGGCPWQAWSVAAVIEVMELMRRIG